MKSLTEFEEKRLTALVESVNLGHAEVKAAARKCYAWLLPFVGQPVYKTDGAFLKKVQQNRPTIDRRIRFNHSQYSISLAPYFPVRFKNGEPPNDRDIEEQAGHSIYLADIQGAVIQNMRSIDDLEQTHRSDYTVEEVRSAFLVSADLYKRMESTMAPYSNLFFTKDHMGPRLCSGR